MPQVNSLSQTPAIKVASGHAFSSRRLGRAAEFTRLRNEAPGSGLFVGGSVYASTPRAYREFQLVKLSLPVEHGGRVWPAGLIGVVVYVHRGGEAYEVEFSEPTADVLTVKTRGLRSVHA